MPPHKNPAAIPKKRPATEFTSLASRKRRQPRCSVASLATLEDETTLEEDFVGLFGKTSDNHLTWGKNQNLPIAATRRKGRGKNRQTINPLAHMFSYREDTEKVPNSPERSFFLNFPLEIRERIYQLILPHGKGIIVKADLGQVESINLRCYSILRVCKQISEEVARFQYQANTFRVVLRKPPVSYYTLNESFVIAPKYLSFIQDITIEGQKDNYDLSWYELASECVEKLGKSKAILQSLTFVAVPQKLRRAVTAMGVVKGAITFADFLWIRGRFMQAFRKLSCKVLKIVIKKRTVVNLPAITLNPIDTLDVVKLDREKIAVKEEAAEIFIKQRFELFLDLAYLLPTQENGPLTNEETIRLRRQNQSIVLKQMSGLKRKFENVFLNHERAVREGICRKLEEKRVKNGVLLMEL